MCEITPIAEMIMLAVLIDVVGFSEAVTTNSTFPEVPVSGLTISHGSLELDVQVLYEFTVALALLPSANERANVS